MPRPYGRKPRSSPHHLRRSVRPRHQRALVRRHRHRADLQKFLLQKSDTQERAGASIPPLLESQRPEPHGHALLVALAIQALHLPGELGVCELQTGQQRTAVPPHRLCPTDGRPSVVVGPQHHRILPVGIQTPTLWRDRIAVPVHRTGRCHEGERGTRLFQSPRP